MPGGIQPNFGMMQPHMPPNMMIPPGAPIHPYTSMAGIPPLGYNPHFIPPYHVQQMPVYTQNLTGINSTNFSNGNNATHTQSPNKTTNSQGLENAENKANNPTEIKSNIWHLSKISNSYLFLLFSFFLNIFRWKRGRKC